MARKRSQVSVKLANIPNVRVGFVSTRLYGTDGVSLEVRKWVDVLPERWAFVHSVLPGITDPASIEFRNEEQLLTQATDPERYYRDVILPQKLDLYEEYVTNRSLPERGTSPS